MYVFVLLYVLFVFVMRVARVFAGCNVCLVILVVYSGFRLFTDTDTEMLILYVSTRAQCLHLLIYTRCNVGAVWAMGMLPFMCGHFGYVAGNERAQPRARERASAGRGTGSRSNPAACPALARASRAARLQCLTLEAAAGRHRV